MADLLRVQEDIYTYIRKRCTPDPVTNRHRGPVHRHELGSGFGPAAVVDAALAALLLEERIKAWQRDASWAYSVEVVIEVSERVALEALRGTNPEVFEAAVNDPRVLDAAVAWFARNPVERTVEAHDVYPGGYGNVSAYKSPGQTRYKVPRLEVVYSSNGDVRLRAR